MGLMGPELSTVDLTANDFSADVPAHLGALASAAPLSNIGRDRRAHARHPRHELEWLRSIRLKFGPAVSVIDLSSGGVLIETTTPLRPGSTTAVTIHGHGLVETAPLHVLRCEVAGIQQGVVYRGACVFDRTIALPSGSVRNAPAGIVPRDRGAVGLDHARHTVQLEQVIELLRDRTTRIASRTVRATWATLLEDVDAALRRGDPPRAILAAIEARTARLTARPARTAPTLVDLTSLDRYGQAPVDEDVQHRAGQSAEGWSKLVVKYLDGRLVKGFSQDFHPSRAHFHIARSIQSAPLPPALVPISQLKAVFFVRDFAGDPTYMERKSFDDTAPGRRIEVTFLDDEVMVGSTLSYRPEGGGFFLTPADSRGNNLRVFIGRSAVRYIRYL